MATIPMGNFGQRVAAARPLTPDFNSGAIDQAAGNLNRVAGGIVEQGQMQETQLSDQRRRAQAALTLAKTGNDLNDAHDEIARQVMDGSVAADKAAGEFRQRASKITTASIGGYIPEQREVMAGHLEQQTGSLQRSLQGVVVKRQQQETASAIDQFGEQVQREAVRQGPGWASQKFGSMVDFTGPAAGLSVEQGAKLKQSFTERVHAQFYEAAGVGALTKGDVPALRQLQEQLAGKDGDPLEPAKRAQLQHQMLTWAKQLEGARSRDQDAADKMASQEVIDLQKFTDAGQVPAIDYQDRVRMLTKGTRWEDPANMLLATAVMGAGHGSQTLPRQKAALQAMDGKPTDPGEFARIGRMREITNTQEAAYKEDPWEAGSRFQRGLPTVLAQPVMNPMQLVQMAGERVPLMNQFEAASGSPMPLLRPAEVPQAIRALQDASIHDRTEILGTVGAQLSAPRIQALADQLEKGSKPLALTLKLGADRTTAGRMASELVQVGAQAIADKTVKKDDTALAGWRAEIAGMVRGTLGDNKAEDDVIEAAYYVRAAQELDGVAAPGFKLPAGADKAIAMVIGQPMERGGVKTFLPRGMSEADFDTKAREKLTAGAGQTVYLRGQPMTVEALSQRWSSYGVRLSGKDTYMPVVNNAPVTVDKEGRVPLQIVVH